LRVLALSRSLAAGTQSPGDANDATLSASDTAGGRAAGAAGAAGAAATNLPRDDLHATLMGISTDRHAHYLSRRI
jgi:hypothetical protein